MEIKRQTFVTLFCPTPEQRGQKKIDRVTLSACAILGDRYTSPMAPQHTLTTAPGLTGWTTETLTMNGQFRYAFGWTNAQPEARRTFGHYNRAWPSRNAGRIIGWPESFHAHHFDSCRWLAAEALDQLDRDFWSDPMTATPDHTAATADALTTDPDTWDERRIQFDRYGSPDTASTHPDAMKYKLGHGHHPLPPERYPQSVYPEWLDACFFGFDWNY